MGDVHGVLTWPIGPNWNPKQSILQLSPKIKHSHWTVIDPKRDIWSLIEETRSDIQLVALRRSVPDHYAIAILHGPSNCAARIVTSNLWPPTRTIVLNRFR